MSLWKNATRENVVRCKDRLLGPKPVSHWATKLGGNMAEFIREEVIRKVMASFPGTEAEVTEIIHQVIQVIKARL